MTAKEMVASARQREKTRPDPVHRESPSPPPRVRTEDQQQQCRNICDICPHQVEVENGVEVCELLRGCNGKSKHPCITKYTQVLLKGKCPKGRFPPIPPMPRP